MLGGEENDEVVEEVEVDDNDSLREDEGVLTEDDGVEDEAPIMNGVQKERKRKEQNRTAHPASGSDRDRTNKQR